jgi:hypothetical protein
MAIGPVSGGSIGGMGSNSNAYTDDTGGQPLFTVTGRRPSGIGAGGTSGTYGGGWDSNTVNNDGPTDEPAVECARSAGNAPVKLNLNKMPRSMTNKELENVAFVSKQLQNLRAAMTAASNHGVVFNIDAEGNKADGQIPASELRDIFNSVTIVPLPGYGTESNGGVGRVYRDALTGEVFFEINQAGLETAGETLEKAIGYLLHEAVHLTSLAKYSGANARGGEMNSSTGKYNPAYERYVNGVAGAIAQNLGFTVNEVTKPSQPKYEVVTSKPSSYGRNISLGQFQEVLAAMIGALASENCGGSNVT